MRIRRVITTREGGVSAPPYDSFNLGGRGGDDPAAVAANQRRLAEGIGLPADRLVWMEQIHGRTATVVDGPRAEAVEATDALVTAQPGLALVVLTADCVPALLADPEAAAVVFGAGWRTTMIGLDLTAQARATAAVRDRFGELGRLEAELLTPILDFYARHRQYRAEGPAVHDACAIAQVLDAGLIKAVPARVDVETQGRFTSGMTVTDFDAADSNADVATELDTAAFWDRVLSAFERVAAGLA